MACSLAGVRIVRQRITFTRAVVLVKTIGIWLTSNRKCEFPCVSTSSTVTGTENYKLIGVFVVCVFHDYSIDQDIPGVSCEPVSTQYSILCRHDITLPIVLHPLAVT
jgi:hypothetical protein